MHRNPYLIFLGATLFDLILAIVLLSLFATIYPGRFRTPLWQEGGTKGWNSDPHQRVYDYANYRKSPPIPLIWDESCTLCNLCIAIVTLFVWLVRFSIMSFSKQVLDFYTTISINALYDVLLAGLWIYNVHTGYLCLLHSGSAFGFHQPAFTAHIYSAESTSSNLGEACVLIFPDVHNLSHIARFVGTFATVKQSPYLFDLQDLELPHQHPTSAICAAQRPSVKRTFNTRSHSQPPPRNAMSVISPDERKKFAATILKLLNECRDKVPNDCPEPTLILLPLSTIRTYVRNVENPIRDSHVTDLDGYIQTMSAVVARIEEIRDNLPTEWQDFSNWLRECTSYPEGTRPHVSTAQPPPKVIFGNSSAGAKTTDKSFSFNVPVKPTEKASTGSPPASSSPPSSTTRDVSPLQLSLPSPASSLKSIPEKTGPAVASANDDKLETILRLLQEEKTARIEAEAKMADAEIKQKQSHDEVLQRIASLEKNHVSLKTITDKQKELDERADSLSKREEAVKTLQAKLEADISRQAATDKALVAKSEEVEKVFVQMQAKLDRMEKEAGARLAKTKTPVTSVKKQKELMKPAILVSPPDSNDKVSSKADKVAGKKRKSVSRIIKVLEEAFPAQKAVIVFSELKRKILRVSKVGKAQRKDFEAQIDKALTLYGTPASKREQHTTMLIDLINFNDAIGRNDDGPYQPLNATIRDAAIEFANDGLSNWLFRSNRWLDFAKVSSQHKRMQAIDTIASLGTSLFDMDWELSSAGQPDEFDDEISATPTEILKKYHGIFSEYGSALRCFLGAISTSSPMYGLVEAYGQREGAITHDSWRKAVRKFGVRF
ncbi:hypothetical protein ACET3X_001750 [Alternaria dauci]|uniref:Uncharacterized protein n=1 Tax=Alternaria dauci TaxID=48095 RepID=A0ABR3UY80_9PLEO